MGRLKTLVATAVVVLVSLSLGVPAVRSDSEELGGQFTVLNATNSYTNPCEGNAQVKGTVNFSATVRANSGSNGHGSVFVSVRFYGGSVTDGTNTFKVNGSAQAFYDTLSDHYVLPTILDYDDQSNESLSFFGPTDTTVFVDRGTQKPFNFGNLGSTATCDQK
jgi:hypothetical protein